MERGPLELWGGLVPCWKSDTQALYPLVEKSGMFRKPEGREMIQIQFKKTEVFNCPQSCIFLLAHKTSEWSFTNAKLILLLLCLKLSIAFRIKSLNWFLGWKVLSTSNSLHSLPGFSPLYFWVLRNPPGYLALVLAGPLAWKALSHLTPTHSTFVPLTLSLF